MLDNRLNLVEELLGAPEDVRSYLAFELHEFQHADNVEAIQAHLSPFANEDRYAVMQEKIKRVIDGL